MPVRMAIIKKSGDNRCWRECGEIGTLLHCWWECKLVQPLWKTVWRFLKALEIEILFDPAIPSLGIYPKDYKSFYSKDTCSIIHNRNNMEYQVLVNGGLYKEMKYIPMEYYTATEKNRIMLFAIT